MCDFCKDYNNWVDLCKKIKSKEIKTKYYARMETVSVKDGIEKARTTHRRHKLNYCPECSKKLE